MLIETLKHFGVIVFMFWGICTIVSPMMLPTGHFYGDIAVIANLVLAALCVSFLNAAASKGRI